MKSQIKVTLTTIVMLAFLLLGYKVGNSVDPDTITFTNGWICGDNLGDCDPNYNVTCCTWGPGAECATGGCN